MLYYRFRYYSWRFIYTVIIATVQTFVALVSVYKILASGVSIKSLGEYLTWSLKEEVKTVLAFFKVNSCRIVVTGK